MSKAFEEAQKKRYGHCYPLASKDRMTGIISATLPEAMDGDVIPISNRSDLKLIMETFKQVHAYWSVIQDQEKEIIRLKNLVIKRTIIPE